MNKTSSNVNSAMKDIQKATGDTANSMNDLNSTMKDTRGSLKDTNNAANEAASGIKSLATLEAGQKMMEFGGKIIDVVKNLMDLTEATKEYNMLVSKLEGSSVQGGYGKKKSKNSAKEVYKYTGDEMSAVNVVTNLQSMGVSQSQLDKTLQSSIAVWTKYGDSIPIEGLTESIAETAQVGKITGNLADALNWVGVSEDDFNKKLESTKSTQERAALITDTLNKLYGNSKNVYDEANKSLLDYNGSQWDSIDAQAKLGEALAPLNSAINGIKSAFAEALAPVIKQIADAIQPVIQKFQEFIKEHPQLVAGITMVVAAITTLIGIIGAIIVVVTTVKLAFAGISAAIGIASGAFAALSAPILIVVGVIAALIAIGVALYKNWDTICAKATELKNWVVEKLNALADAANNAFDQMVSFITSAWNAIWNTICFIGNMIWTDVVNLWNGICNTVSTVGNAIVSFVTSAWNGICNVVTTIGSMIYTSIMTNWNTIKTIISITCTVIKTIVTNIWNAIKTAISTILNAIKTVVTTAWNAIKNAVKVAMDAIKNTAVNAFNNVKEKISGVISDIKSAWEGLRNTITNNPITATVRKVTESLTGAEDGQRSAWGTRYVHGNNVPYRLHDGEAILTAREARQYRQGKNNSPQINITMNGTVIREEQDITKIASDLVRKINEQRIIT